MVERQYKGNNEARNGAECDTNLEDEVSRHQAQL